MKDKILDLKSRLENKILEYRETWFASSSTKETKSEIEGKVHVVENMLAEIDEMLEGSIISNIKEHLVKIKDNFEKKIKKSEKDRLDTENLLKKKYIKGRLAALYGLQDLINETLIDLVNSGKENGCK